MHGHHLQRVRALAVNPDNVGIASALNALVDLNSAAGLDWIVTLDQDSVPPAGMVSALAEYADEETPLLTPRIEDRRKKTSATDPRHANLPPVQYFTSAAQKGAITSGALLNVEALREVGGFDDQFFIDYVDYDLNMRLLTAGYKIARINGTHLSHQVGEAGRTWLVTPRRGIDGRWHLERFYSFGHSPTRCYYKARNRVLYTKKHWRRVGFSNEGVLQIPQQIALTVLFEDQRWAKLTAFARGIYDGMRTPVGKRIAP